MDVTRPQLTRRQAEVLRRVVEEYVATGQPVGSKSLVERARLTVSPSTVRAELAELESLGLLTHPHTSAGRVPTERGYRYYASALLDSLEPRPPAFALELRPSAGEVEEAMQATTEMLSQLTHLLALVSAPPLETTTVRHVEVLRLQPQVVVVVVITSTGDVAKRVIAFDGPVDPGLVESMAQYLNECVVGLRLGARALRRRLEDPGMGARERAFLEAIKPAFTDLVADGQRLYVGGAAGLLDDVREDELQAYRGLLEHLERRAELLELLASLESRRVFVRVGEELDAPALRELALVGATYGLVNRTLGAVSLVGPVRMDYEKALRSVRAAASELSRFVGEVYGED